MKWLRAALAVLSEREMRILHERRLNDEQALWNRLATGSASRRSACANREPRAGEAQSVPCWSGTPSPRRSSSAPARPAFSLNDQLVALARRQRRAPVEPVQDQELVERALVGAIREASVAGVAA